MCMHTEETEKLNNNIIIIMIIRSNYNPIEHPYLVSTYINFYPLIFHKKSFLLLKKSRHKEVLKVYQNHQLETGLSQLLNIGN